MPMSQDDIRRHYEQNWKQTSDGAGDQAALAYSDPVEDAVLYPIYRQLLADLNLPAAGARILDVGSGSGRWIRFFLEHLTPALLMGVDFTQASIDLLKKWHAAPPPSPATQDSALSTQHSALSTCVFRQADITQPGLDLGERFDLVNVANVLFHIPEPDRFAGAIANLRNHLAPGGRIVTTEYLPRLTMRTQWMLVRSRYDFERDIAAAGLRIIEIRPTTFFANDPMGIDGPDDKTRAHFNTVRAMAANIFKSNLDASSRQFFVNFLAQIERACLAFCGERLAPVDLPSQKLVVLGAR